MAQSDEGTATVPTTAVERAYVSCLNARQRYIQVGSATAETDTMDELHADLHASVMTWYEALHPHMADRPGEVGDYWHEAPLWPKAMATKEALVCSNCEIAFDDDIHAEGDVCEECGEAHLEPSQIPKQTDDGELLFEWEVGLKSLEKWFRKTETTTQTSGTFRPSTSTIEVPHRLKPEYLFRIARYLDKAAEEMDLLADTSEALPLGEL